MTRCAHSSRNGQTVGIVELAEADTAAEDELAMQGTVANCAYCIVRALLANWRASQTHEADSVIIVARQTLALS